MGRGHDSKGFEEMMEEEIVLKDGLYQYVKGWSKQDFIEQWLRDHVPTRMNLVTMRIEYKENGKWVAMSDHKRNSILRAIRKFSFEMLVHSKDGEKIKEEPLSTTSAKLDQILESDFSPEVDVFKEYFQALPTVDGTTSINGLAASLTMREEGVVGEGEIGKVNKLWRLYFTKWLVAAVANFHNDQECENQTMLVLVGKQNDGKTTWLNNLVPRSLNPTYRFCSGLQDPRGKDAMTVLTNQFIVNIDDQLGSINKKDADGIKNLITMPRVTMRLPYQKYVSDFPHRASLCGSLNYSGFMTDATGNRRYLPFELADQNPNNDDSHGIDWSYLNRIDIDQVWAEALSLWKSGHEYKVSKDELAHLEEHNRSFRMPSTEEDLIGTWLELPTDYDSGSKMTNEQLVGYLTEAAGPNLRRILSINNVRRIMQANGYEYRQVRITDQKQGKMRPYMWSVKPLYNSDLASFEAKLRVQQELAE